MRLSAVRPCKKYKTPVAYGATLFPKEGKDKIKTPDYCGRSERRPYKNGCPQF